MSWKIEHGAVLVDRQVADLVDHQQGRMGEHAQPPGQIAGGLGLGEGLDQRRERAVVDAPAGLGHRDREADRQVRFPDAWWAEQDHVLAAVQEAELVQALDLLALDAGLEGEVELIERLHSRQPRRARRAGAGAFIAAPPYRH